MQSDRITRQMLDRVSSHAVTRFVQRVLKITVDGPFLNNTAEAEARAHCRAAGLSFVAVKRKILTPAVLMAIRTGCPTVLGDGFEVVLDPHSGAIKTISLTRTPRSRAKDRLRRSPRRRKITGRAPEPRNYDWKADV